jgi:hypothetical protein
MFSIVNVFASLWGVSFLVHTALLSQQTAANMVAVIFIGVAIVGPFSSWLSKIINQRHIILLGGGSCTGVTTSMIIFCPHIPEGILFLLFFLIEIFSSVYILYFGMIKESVSPVMCTTTLAAMNMLIMSAASLL